MKQIFGGESIIRGTPLAPRVRLVSPLGDYKLSILFTNNERRIFDARPLLSLKVFAPLSNRRFFELVKVERGSIAWPNDIDYCPDTLYAESVPADNADIIDKQGF